MVFDEERFWQWNEDRTIQHIPPDFDEENDAEEQRITEHMQQPIDNQNEPLAVQNSTIKQRPQCLRRRPVWMSDYEVTGIDQSEDPLLHFALFADCDPVTFDAAVKE